jgi:hypothetical protein
LAALRESHVLLFSSWSSSFFVVFELLRGLRGFIGLGVFRGLLIGCGPRPRWDRRPLMRQTAVLLAAAACYVASVAEASPASPPAAKPGSGPSPAASPDEAWATGPLPAPGRQVGVWNLATADTHLTVGATDQGQMCIYGLSAPGANWNWAPQPSIFDLPAFAKDTDRRELRWAFKGTVEDKSLGHQVTLRFECEQPNLELRSEWWARPGRGPVRHAMRITNKSGKPVTLVEQPSIHAALATGDAAITLWTFHSDGGSPDKTGVYRLCYPPGNL